MKTYGEVVQIDPGRVRPFPGQPREYFDKADMESLEASIRQRGQIQPGLVRELDGEDVDFELVDGQRRWTACARLGVKFCAVIIDPENEAEQYEISVTANFQGSSHTPMEIAKACNRLYHAGRSDIYIATLFGKTNTWVARHRYLINLIPELQDLIDPAKIPDHNNRLGTTVAQEVARLPEREQREKLKQIHREGIRSLNLEKIKIELRDTGEVDRRSLNPVSHFRVIGAFLDRFNRDCPKTQRRLVEHKGLMESFRKSGRLDELLEKIQVAKKVLEDIEALISSRLNRFKD